MDTKKIGDYCGTISQKTFPEDLLNGNPRQKLTLQPAAVSHFSPRTTHSRNTSRNAPKKLSCKRTICSAGCIASFKICRDQLELELSLLADCECCCQFPHTFSMRL